jgi:transposase InsO family protein
MVKYAWIKEHEAEFSVKSMCRFMSVSRSAYYAWLGLCEPRRLLKIDDIELLEIIKTLFKKSRKTYGTRRIKEALIGLNRHVSRRIGRLMGIAGLACKTKRKFIATTNSNHKLPIAANLLDRQFTVQQPNQTYIGDITYIHTREGWLYLAVVIDLYSRQIVGWSMAEHMRTKLVNDALLMAIWKRIPAKGLIWDSDRGSQYASDSHRALGGTWHYPEHESQRQLLG